MGGAWHAGSTINNPGTLSGTIPLELTELAKMQSLCAPPLPTLSLRRTNRTAEGKR
jgi:hypothetical protein